MRQVARLGFLLTALAPTTGWTQAMVEVPNAPPPPPPTVAQPHRGPSRYEVLIEATPGVAVPLGGGYAHDFGPSFTMDGHVGLVVWMRARRWALVPELAVGGTTLAATDNVGGGGHSRVRGEAGLRVLVPLGHHLVVYPRVAVGGDYFSGQFLAADTVPGSRGPVATVGTASSFLCEAGAGLMATIGRHVALGAYVGVPVTPVMKIDYTTMQGIQHIGSDRFTAVELTATGVVALRL
jgi:hypothetical protein